MDPFLWHPIDLPDGAALLYRGVEVARLDTRAGRTWATLRYVGKPPVERPCTGFEQGRQGVMLWALRYRTVLTDAIDRQLDAENSDSAGDPGGAS